MSSVSAGEARQLLVEVARGTRGHDISAREERAIMHQCLADSRRRLLRVAGHLDRKAYRPAKREAYDYRCSLAGRTQALWTSLPPHLRDQPLLAPSDNNYLRALRWRTIAVELGKVGHLDQSSTARLTARPKGKASADGPRRYRPVFTFDWLDLAKQRLIASSLTPFVDLHPSQYMLRQTGRRGRSAVCEALLERLPQMGPGHVFVQLDVKAFHQNIDHGWLEGNLPCLSKEIIRSHGHTGGMIHVPVKGGVKARLGLTEVGAYENLIRRGIPTGSALSALIGEYVMGAVLRGLADHPSGSLMAVHSGDFHAYSDNLGVFVDRAQAAAIVDLLQRAFASSPAGPFELRAAVPRPVRDPFKFLGYWFRIVGGVAKVFVPDHLADEKLSALTEDLPTADAQAIARTRKRIEGIAADWNLWDGVVDWKAEALSLVASAEAALASQSTSGRAQTRQFAR